MDDDLDAVIAAARAAFRQHEWHDARTAFLAARATAQDEGRDLDGDDLAALADAAWWLGLIDESCAVGAAACRELAATGRARAAAMVAIGIAINHFLRAEEEQGSGWIARAADLVAGEPECAEHGYLRYLLDVEPAVDGADLEAAADAAQAVRDLGRRVGDPSLVACATQAKGRALLRAGYVPAGLALLDEAMVAVAATEVAPEWSGHIYCNVMAACYELADYGRARRWTAATERWLLTLPTAVLFTGICRVHRAQLLRLGGRWMLAEQEAARVCADLVEIDCTAAAEGHYQLGEILRLRGSFAGAEEAYRLAHRLGRHPQPGLALLRLAESRADVAAAAILSALTAEADNRLLRAPLWSAQVEIALAAGDQAAARKAADELEDVAAEFGSSGLRAAALHAQGRVRYADGDGSEALRLLRAACRAWHDLEAPYETARARVDLALAHRRLGDGDTAELELDAAAAAFSDLGAVPDLVGVAALRGRDAHPDGLTDREVEVLRCLAVGRSNREIAAALRISEKTVARHLANIFTKLGIGSRTAAAAYAFQHDLVPAGDR